MHHPIISTTLEVSQFSQTPLVVLQADITRHAVGDRFWEVYRFLLIDKPELALSTPRIRSLIADRVRNILMG